MAVVEKTVDLIGDDALCDIILSRNVPEGFPTDLYDDTVKYIKMQALYYVSGLTSVTFENVTSISQESISHCPNLKKIVMPKLGAIYTSGIRENPELEELECPLVETISNYGLSLNTKLKSAVFPKLRVADQGAFY